MSVYEQFGVTPIINASGSVTRLGGAPMPAEVVQAYCDASQAAVSLEQLQAAASKRIAAHTGTDAALVTSGAAAALTLGAAAILTGSNLGRMERLPQTHGFPNEFVIAREQRSGYDHAVRASGGILVEVGFNEIVSNAGVRRTEVWEYEAAFGPNTAGVFYGFSPHSQPSLEDVVAVAHRHNLPVLVDAAGELPPRKHLTGLPKTGADLIAFSGGKAIRGPQSTGILCGRQNLITAAALQMLDMDDHWELWDPPKEFIDKQQLPGHPRHGIGRGMKVSKEEIAALLTAFDLFTSGAYDKQLPVFRSWLETIREALSETSAKCEIVEPTDPERWSNLVITVPAESAFEVCRKLREGTPPIYVGHGELAENRLVITPFCLREDQIPILAARLKEELSAI